MARANANSVIAQDAHRSSVETDSRLESVAPSSAWRVVTVGDLRQVQTVLFQELLRPLEDLEASAFL